MSASGELFSKFTVSNGKFYARYDILPRVIDTIADDLIATGHWSDADATWVTTVTTGQSCRRALLHIADSVYLSLVAENTDGQRTLTIANYFKGLVAILSSGWDAGLHIPTGTLYFTYVPIWFHTSSFSIDICLHPHEVKLYTAKEGFALSIGGRSYITGTQPFGFSCVLVVERNASKLYADAFSNFFMFADHAPQAADLNTYGTTTQMFSTSYKWWRISRPFNYQAQTGYDAGYGATLSQRDDKVYYSKPIIHNDAVGVSPIFQAELFYFLPRNYQKKIPGLLQGDEISAPTGTAKFCVCDYFQNRTQVYNSAESHYPLAIRKCR